MIKRRRESLNSSSGRNGREIVLTASFSDLPPSESSVSPASRPFAYSAVLDHDVVLIMTASMPMKPKGNGSNCIGMSGSVDHGDG